MRVRTHPGEVLRHEYLQPLELSATALAEALDVPANRITDIVRGHRDVSADTALRLAEFFDTSPEFWMNLQTAHDLSKAEAERAKRPAVKMVHTIDAAKKIGRKIVAAATDRTLRENRTGVFKSKEVTSSSSEKSKRK